MANVVTIRVDLSPAVRRTLDVTDPLMGSGILDMLRYSHLLSAPDGNHIEYAIPKGPHVQQVLDRWESFGYQAEVKKER